MRSALFGAVLAAILVGGPASARADVIWGPEEGCPPGSYEEYTHGAAWCAPSICADPSACRNETRCKEKVGLCVKDVTRSSGGRMPEDEVTTFVAREVTGSCSKTADCSDGAKCEIASRCVPSKLKKVLPSKRSVKRACSGCGDDTRVGWIALLGPLALLRRRRR